MKTNSVTRIVLLLGVVAAAVHAQDPEPNWTNRFLEVKSQYVAQFRGPATGKTVTIVRRIGGDFTGRLDSFSSDAVVIDGQRFEMRQLTDDTCDKLFAAAYATRRARQLVMQERDSYRRTQAEIQQKQKAWADIALERTEAPGDDVLTSSPSKATQPLTTVSTKPVSSSTSDQPSQNASSSGSTVLGAIACAVVVLLLFAGRRPTRCDICGVPFRRVYHTWTIKGGTKRVCPKCNQAIEWRKSQEGIDNLFGR